MPVIHASKETQSFIAAYFSHDGRKYQILLTGTGCATKDGGWISRIDRWTPAAAGNKRERN